MAPLTPAEGGATPPAPAASAPPAEPAKPAPVVRLRWRADLKAASRELEGGRQIVVEDPIGGRFFRLGPKEYALARTLDGERDLGAALAEANRSAAGTALTPDEATAVVQFLLRHGLVEEVVEGRARASRQPPPPPRKRMGPLFQRLPLGNPNRLLGRLMPLLGWIGGPWFLPLWLGAAIWAGVLLVGDWDRWLQQASGVLDRDNLFWLPVGWVLLKVWHELNHGIVAKRYGADVVECGILFVLFAPIGGYVDATSSWRLRSRWQRLHVSAAGIVAETFLGAVAAIVWATQPPGALADLAYNVALLATISTVLFNANPLMRFDGYYVLIDLIQRPNLYQRGMQYCRYLGRRYLLGAGRAAAEPAYGAEAPRFVKVYGVLTLLWRWMVMVTILVLATAWFSGLGILLFIAGLATWLVLPAVKLVRRERAAGGVGLAGFRRAAALLLGFAAILTAVHFLVPLRPTVEAPGLVAYEDSAVLRAEANGYLVEVAARRGDRVTGGMAVLRLENPQLEADARRLAAAIAALEIEISQALTLGELERAAARRGERAVLAEELADVERQLSSLTVAAPHDGVVIESELQVMQGAFLKRGEALAEVADPARLRFEISIAEQDIASFRARLGESVEVVLPGGRSLQGRLVEVAPRGSLELPPEALTALAGGEIALRSVETPDGMERQPLEARFKGVVKLPAEAVSLLHAGEVGYVALPGEERRLFGLLAEGWRHWTEGVLAHAG